jgi:hypothetical protein
VLASRRPHRAGALAILPKSHEQDYRRRHRKDRSDHENESGDCIPRGSTRAKGVQWCVRRATERAFQYQPEPAQMHGDDEDPGSDLRPSRPECQPRPKGSHCNQAESPDQSREMGCIGKVMAVKFANAKTREEADEEKQRPVTR